MLEKYERIKSLGSDLDFGFNWTRWLDEGESIVSYVFTNVDENLVVSDDILIGNYVIFFVSGGQADKWHEITCRITTDALPKPRIDERTLRIYVTQR